jgi:NADH dehydrogenase (ubiquinone) 1 alpha subcomplex subunit 5
MRAVSRLLASVKSAQLLEAGAPTGLCGLRTHPAPRSTLIYLYNSTLDKLNQFPESSVYRQSTEALTKHRLQIVKETKPKGWDAWQDKISLIIADDPGAIDVKSYHVDGEIIVPQAYNQPRTWIRPPKPQEAPMQPEGIRTEHERRFQDIKLSGKDKKYDPERELSRRTLDPEPPYTREQYVSLMFIGLMCC